MRVLLVAAPLVTKGGVYRTTHELVSAATSNNLPWRGLVGLRNLPVEQETERVSVVPAHKNRLGQLRGLKRHILSMAQTHRADAIISLIPQSDMALMGLQLPSTLRVVYLRGAPWPQKGESPFPKRRLWELLEMRALSKADAVWSTTEILRRDAKWPRARIVPAGIDLSKATKLSARGPSSLVFAARHSADKNPYLFIEVAQATKLKARMYGQGELSSRLKSSASANVAFKGWADPSTLWAHGDIYLGTSFREAFGRSAVEAAAHGLPIVLSDRFGAAPLLITEPELRRRFVLNPNDAGSWINAVNSLLESPALRTQLAEHVFHNANRLSIEESVKRISHELSLVRGAGD